MSDFRNLTRVFLVFCENQWHDTASKIKEYNNSKTLEVRHY